MEAYNLNDGDGAPQPYCRHFKSNSLVVKKAQGHIISTTAIGQRRLSIIEVHTPLHRGQQIG